MHSVASKVAARRMTLSGISALRKLLAAERREISRAPVLVIASQVGDKAPFVAQVDHICKRVELATCMESGIRTISSQVTSVFPLIQDLQSRKDLANRIGAETVIGVGSKAAMDLAKAVLETHDKSARGILVPGTYSAALAATSSHSLLLNTDEEGLVAHDVDSTDVTVILETDTLTKLGNSRHAVWASMAIGLDALQRDDDDLSSILDTLEQSLLALDDELRTADAVTRAGRLLSFGLADTRSAPLALAVSLIPTVFPTSSMMTFMASLLPGMAQVASSPSSAVEEKIHAYIQHDDDIPSLSSLLTHGDSALSVPDLISLVRSNRSTWNCIDVEEDMLETILRYSLDR